MDPRGCYKGKFCFGTSDAEFVKDFMVDADNIVCPEVKSKIEAFPMSRKTKVRRIEAIAVNLHQNLLNIANTFNCSFIL